MTSPSAGTRSDELLALFNRAVALHSSGRLAEARSLYEGLLRQLPKHPGLLDLYGTVRHQLGDHGVAAGYLERAVSGNPSAAGAWNHLGAVRRAQGRSDSAIRVFRRSAVLDPSAAEPWMNLGLVARDTGENATVIREGTRAMAIRPDLADVEIQVGGALAALGRPEAAATHLMRVRATDPLRPDLALHLSGALGALGDHRGALRAARAGIAASPGVYELYPRLIGARDPDVDTDAFVTWARFATRIRPGDARLWANRAAELYQAGRFEDGLREARRASILAPSDRAALQNLIAAAHHLCRYQAGRRAARRALAAHPRAPDLLYAAAEAEFVIGDLGRAWDLYEARTERADATARRGLPAGWRGPGTGSGPLLVVAEQGIGDEVVFLSCLPDLLAAVSVPVVVEVDRRLVATFQRSFPGVTVVPRQVDPAQPGRRVLDYRRLVASEGITEFVHCGSLPRYFRADRDRPCGRAGYLVPDPALVARWRAALSPFHGTKLVGVGWRSARMNRLRARFHADISDWEPIFSAHGCTFVSLMPGDVEREREVLRRRHGIELRCLDGLDAWNDIDSLMALMAVLDVVVIARTATCAFAGAIGVPTIRVAQSFNRITDGCDLFFAGVRPVLARTAPFDPKAAAAAAGRLLRERIGTA